MPRHISCGDGNSFLIGLAGRVVVFTTTMTSPTARDVCPSPGHVSSLSSMPPSLVHRHSSDFCALCATGLNLSNRVAMMAWYRSKAKISRLLHDASSKACTKHEATCRLPFEIVEMIIINLTHDLGALKMCSLTCRSWYTIAIPHIHHTLVLKDKMFDTAHHKFKPLAKMHKLGLTPHVKEIRVGQLAGPYGWFGPDAFSGDDLFYFSTFSNVHTLRIQGFNIDRFMPTIRRHFRQFLPTLRSISLYFPTCSAPRHLSYFLSLFPNLDNIEIRQFLTSNVQISNTRLFLPPAPKLRGQLTLHDFLSPEIWTYLISISGGLRFRGMVLRKVGTCASILLEACAETLERLRIYLTDDPG